jgi:hypothetical protein
MKKRISIIINILIVIIELIALKISYAYDNRIMIEYYTIDSNLLALLSSIVYLFYIFSKSQKSNVTRILKYISTICLLITFLVVIFVLLPMLNFNFKTLLISGAMFPHHVLCPILSFITFVWFDDLGKFNKKDYCYPVIATLIYAFVLIILNLLTIVDGPYPFLRVYNQSILSSIIWFVLIIYICYLISKYVLKLRNQPMVHLK